MVNLAIYKLKETIINDINNSKLPPAVVNLILGELKTNLDAYTKQVIEAEIKAEESEKEAKAKAEEGAKKSETVL